MIQMIDSFQKVGLSQINELEAMLHIEIPEDYRLFLLSCNGGRPRKHVFTYIYEGRQEMGCVSRFLGIHEGEWDNLHQTTKTYKIFQKRLPDNLLPIANDPGGNLICLSLTGNDLGSIYFWDHDWEGEEPSYENTFLIATSFTEFIDSLMLDDEM